MYNHSEIINDLVSKIEKGDVISPFLFLGANKDLLSGELKSIALDLLNHFEIPSTYFYTLEDNGESIKVNEIKDFFYPSNLTPPYKIQIFFIENIGRMTLQSANSVLKIFEEPGKINIIFLSEASESMILDTILSRVQIQKIGLKGLEKRDDFYISIIDSYLKSGSTDLISYFYRNKLEKEDYVRFLENLIIYAKENFILTEFLDEINEDLNMILTNNLNARGVVDKWILKVK